MNRRGFLAAALAVGMAPMIVKAGVLMPVRQLTIPSRFIIHGDGIHDDATALQAFFNGQDVFYRNGDAVGAYLHNQTFLIGKPIVVPNMPKHRQVTASHFRKSRSFPDTETMMTFESTTREFPISSCTVYSR